MPITNFDFPGVSFRQTFASAPANTQSVLGVACVGTQYQLHNADSKDAVKLDQTTPYSATNGLVATVLPGTGATLDADASSQHLVVKDGAFLYKTQSAGSADVNARTVTFAVALADGYGYTAADGFGTRGVRVGDPVLLTGTGGTALTSVLKLDYVDGVGFAKITVGDMGSLTAVSSAGFCETLDATYEAGSGTFVLNTSSTANNLTILGGLTAKIDDLGGITGTLQGGDFYFEYRERVQQYVNKLGTIDSVDDIAETLGEPCRDNPLALACLFAFYGGSGANTVYFTGVASETASAYADALDFLEKYDGIYSIVPATEDAAVIQACAASCIAASDNEESTIRRVLWYGVTADASPAIWTGSGTITAVDGSTPAFATTTTNVYADTALQAGDKLEIVSSGETYEITSVTSPTTINLSGTPAATAGDVQLRILRTLPTNADIVADVIKRRCTTSERAMCVWADGLVYNGEALGNYPLAAAAAGMRSYEEPHRPLSNLGYTFFSLSDTHGMSKSQLKRIGAQGIWIIANNVDGTPINMRQLTTAVANNINLDEESIISNIDTIALDMCQTGRAYVGSSNISPTLLDVLEGDIRSHMDKYLTNATDAYVGPQLISWDLLALYQDTVNLDHVYANFECTPPKPFNKFYMHMRVL